MSNSLIKVVGAQSDPLDDDWTTERALVDGVIGFPRERRPNVGPGDRMWLYGVPGRRIFALYEIETDPEFNEAAGRWAWQVQAKPVIGVMRVKDGVPPEDVGIRLTSLRQQSHIFIDAEVDAQILGRMTRRASAARRDPGMKATPEPDQVFGLYERLRRPPAPHAVGSSLPVLFFGDLFAAEVATVGLNPSDREYLSRDGELLAGRAQRFATLESLGARDRASLTDEQCGEAVRWMRDYFAPGKPVYGSWFNAHSRVLEGLGVSFVERSAAHLDLVQEATSPVWNKLPAAEREALLDRDLPFLEWEIRPYPLRAVICTGKTVGVHVRRLLGVEVVEEGSLARVKWWVGAAGLGGRSVAVAGWNHPLARATGLGTAGERELGRLLAGRLSRVAG